MLHSSIAVKQFNLGHTVLTIGHCVYFVSIFPDTSVTLHLAGIAINRMLITRHNQSDPSGRVYTHHQRNRRVICVLFSMTAAPHARTLWTRCVCVVNNTSLVNGPTPAPAPRWLRGANKQRNPTAGLQLIHARTISITLGYQRHAPFWIDIGVLFILINYVKCKL